MCALVLTTLPLIICYKFKNANKVGRVFRPSETEADFLWQPARFVLYKSGERFYEDAHDNADFTWYPFASA